MQRETKSHLQTKYQHDPNIVSRVIADEVILVPIHNNVADMDLIYTLNETAARVWQLTDGQHSLADIHQVLLEEFAADPNQVEQDLIELTEGLHEIGALIKVEN